MITYVIKVARDGNPVVTTYSVEAPNVDTARLLAFAMDGGLGYSLDNWGNCIELAKVWTTVIATHKF